MLLKVTSKFLKNERDRNDQKRTKKLQLAVVVLVHCATNRCREWRMFDMGKEKKLNTCMCVVPGFGKR